jgi:hypothetical protein
MRILFFSLFLSPFPFKGQVRDYGENKDYREISRNNWKIKGVFFGCVRRSGGAGIPQAMVH